MSGRSGRGSFRANAVLVRRGDAPSIVTVTVCHSPLASRMAVGLSGRRRTGSTRPWRVFAADRCVRRRRLPAAGERTVSEGSERRRILATIVRPPPGTKRSASVATRMHCPRTSTCLAPSYLGWRAGSDCVNPLSIWGPVRRVPSSRVGEQATTSVYTVSTATSRPNVVYAENLRPTRRALRAGTTESPAPTSRRRQRLLRRDAGRQGRNRSVTVGHLFGETADATAGVPCRSIRDVRVWARPGTSRRGRVGWHVQELYLA
jgi:hypothetical protein